jgi:acyl-CoA thioesterase I
MSPARFHRHHILSAQVHCRQGLSRYGQALAIVNTAARAAGRWATALALALGIMGTLGVAGVPGVKGADANEPVRLLVLGDSLTAGYGLPQDQSFPAQLERALRAASRDVTVINAGVSGDTAAGGLARLEWTLGGTPGGAPDAAIVQLGANDALRGLDPQATFSSLSAILARLKERGIPVLLAGMLAPPNLGSEYAEAFAAIYPQLAEEHDVLLYPFFLEGVAGESRLNQVDGIHPTAQGVMVIVNNILPAVEELLQQARQAERPVTLKRSGG